MSPHPVQGNIRSHAALPRLLPCLAQKVRNFTRNARRQHYAELAARALPIASGAIEAGVRVVNSERLKNACMHWSVAGARAVLALRAVALSPLRCWQAFWADRPWMERPSTRDLAPLRKVA